MELVGQDAVGLLRKAGLKIPAEFDENRKLILEVEEEKLRFILAKPMDVATYVEQGVADIGIAGGDGKVALFKKGQVIRTVPEADAVEELIKELELL